MPWTKEDRAFKILINKRVTSSGKSYYEEFGDNTLDISFSEIKTQLTPYNDPAQGIIDKVVKSYSMFMLTEDDSVLPAQTCYYAYDPADTSRNGDSRLKNWISDKYGKLYTLKLYDNAENEITPTACNWFFDYTTGILTFDGAIPNYPKPFKVKGYRYVGAMGGKIGGGFGQKELYDLDYFPTNQAAANDHFPVYNSTTDRYELKPMPVLTTSNIELVTKRFDTVDNQPLFTVDTVLAKIIFVAVNGVVQTEGTDYSVSGRDIMFSSPVGAGKHVVIHYFKTLNSTVIVEGNTNIIESPSYQSLDFDPVARTLNLIATKPANSIKSNIMTIFDYKFTNSWSSSQAYKYGDYVFYRRNLYYSLKTIDNVNIIPIDGADWLLLLVSGSGQTVERTVTDNTIDTTHLIIVPEDYSLVILTVGGNSTSPDGKLTVTGLDGISNGHSVRIYPAGGVVLRFTDSNTLLTDGGLGAEIQGNHGDWIEFNKRGGKYYQINAGYYTPLPPA